MSEEKNEEKNEQQTFLNEHEELLNSIRKKEEPVEEQAEPVKEAPEAATDAPAAEEDPKEAEPEAESGAEPESADEPVAAEAPAPAEEKTAKPEPAESPAKAPRPPAAKKRKPTAAPAEQRHSPQHEEILKKQALEQNEVKEVLTFIRKYAKPAGIAIAVICAVILADRFFKNQRFKKEAAADAALLEARGAADLQEVVDKYESTPSGPIALMELAREKFNTGQYDEAEALYARFTKDHGRHELAEQAALNLISCTEAKGQLDEAHRLYGEFATAHEGSHLVPAALLGQARCLEVQGKLGEAQRAYEDIIVNYADSGWSRTAEANLKTVISNQQ